jgi:putative SOS response-associated peptidase YedK
VRLLHLPDSGSGGDHGYDPAGTLDSFTIMTEANNFLIGSHHRIPVLLTPEHYGAWLDPDTPVEAALELLTSSPNDLLQAVPLDPCG